MLVEYPLLSFESLLSSRERPQAVERRAPHSAMSSRPNGQSLNGRPPPNVGGGNRWPLATHSLPYIRGETQRGV